MMLESVVHAESSFVTLTYSDEFIPDKGSLEKRDLQLFMKRIRKNTGLPLRYFAVGEYGDDTWRPHYHLALFGLSPMLQPAVNSSWGLGFVEVGDLTFASAAYVAGYCSKKLNSPADPRLNGRYPEFALMSRRPGIGAPAVQTIADALSNRAGWDAIEKMGDVPAQIQHGGKHYPLGTYLRKKLRVAMNFEQEGQTEESRLAQAAEMRALWEDNIRNAKSPALTVKKMVEQLGAQKALQLEKRSKIYAARKKL